MPGAREQGAIQQARELFAEHGLYADARRGSFVGKHAIESFAVRQEARGSTLTPDAAAASGVHVPKIGERASRKNPWRE